MYINIPKALDLIQHSHEENKEFKGPIGLYEPRNYIMSMPGKKMRALLCLLGYGLYRDDIEEALDVAYVVELFHNFTLVHDDIMDDAELRRGMPSVHVKYDQSSAILSGDVMIIEVYDRISRLLYPMSYLIPFNKMAREVCEGQSMDMDFEQRDDVQIQEYLKMIELKTAVLLGCSFKMGAIKAGASEQDQNHLYHFGVNAGIGFQLQDDLLDVYGDPKLFGKKVGGDIIQGKKTYLYLRALALLEGDDKESFKRLYQNEIIDSKQKVADVTSIFDELYIKNYCEEAKKAFFELAVAHMTEVKAPEEKKSELVEFSKTLLNRNK